VRGPAERQVEGTIDAQLPGGLYRVGLEGGGWVTAHAAGGTGRNYIRLLVGDRVAVALMPRDLTRGRILSVVRGST
jgi:translation initiation factor IF-1